MTKPRRRATRDDDGLNDQQARFVKAFILDPRPRRAAIRAGYSVESAGSEAARLMKIPAVQRAIQEHRDELAEQFEVSKERIIAELALIGFSNMGDYTRLTDGGDRVIDLSDTPREHLAAIQEITTETIGGGDDEERTVIKTKLKLMSKREALVDLGKTLGLFTSGGDDGNGGGPRELRVKIIGGLPKD